MTQKLSTRRFLLATLFFLMFTMTGPSAHSWATETIRVGIFQNKPIVYFDDSPKGLFVEILDYVAQKENWELEYVSCELQECLNFLESNKIDLMTALGSTQERSRYLSFTQEPVWSIWGTIYAQNQDVHGIFDLADKKIGVLKGSRITAALQKMLTEFDIPVQYVAFDNYESIYKAFKDHNVDTFSVNSTHGFDEYTTFYSHKTPIVFSPFSIYFAAPLNGRHTKKLAVINDYVKELKADRNSLFYKFEKQWFGDTETFWTGKRIGLISASFLFITICLMALWRYQSLVSLNKDLTQNIIERKRAESDLLFTKFSIDHISDSVFWIDKDGRFAYVNKSACQNLGYSQEELLTMSVHDVDPNFPEKEWAGHWQELKDKGSFLLKTQHKTKKDRLFPVEVVVNYMAFEGKEYNCAFARDITARIIAEEDHAKMEEQLFQSQKMESIGTLAGGIAHDFNNILAAVMGYTELALTDDGVSREVRGYLDEILRGGNRAKELVKEILTFSRKSSRESAPLKIQTITKEVLKLLRSSIPTTIEISPDINPDCKVVLADPTQIHQLIMNLCTNAYHSMRETAGVLTVSVQPAIVVKENHGNKLQLQPGEYVNLEISDTGTGMTEDVLANIFEPYYTTKEQGEGTGLGLAVVHGIVTSLSGKISVSSEVGKGTTFSIYLPTTQTSGESPHKELPAQLLKGRERILLVDDDEAIVAMNLRMLKQLGYQVTAHTSSEDTINTFRRKPGEFDLLITDMTMPKMTGAELCQQILAIRPKMPIILCTGYSELIDQATAEDIGFQAYLTKPILLQDLSMTIRKVLDAS